MAFLRASKNNAYPEILMKFTVNSNMTITAVSGDITLLQADAVVVGEDQWLAGAGGSSGAIARAGGHAYVTAKQALQSQQLPAGPTSVLWCEAGHSLPFHRVYHAILPKMSKHWSAEQRRTALAALYTRVCEEAEDQNQETSIVFPVLGSGQAGGGAEDSVWAALDGLEAFPAISLQEVFLVEKDQQRANKMVAVCQRWIQSQQSENAHVTILPLDSFSEALPGMAPTRPKTTMYQTGTERSRANGGLGNFNYHMEKVVRRREEKRTAQGTGSRGRALKATSAKPWNNPSGQRGQRHSSGNHGDTVFMGNMNGMNALDKVMSVEEIYEGEAFPREDSEEEDDLPPAVEILSLDEDSEEYRFEVEDASFPTRQRRKVTTSTGESKDFSRSLTKLAPEVSSREQASMRLGRMSHCVHDDVQLPGHEGFGVIVIDYVIPDGTQGPEHPQPGSPYSGSVERAFLPDTGQGRHVLTLLEKAFDRRLTFQVCVQPGGQALVEWADIPHKTFFRGDRDRGGYPDCDYLATVQDVLRDKYGIQ